MQRTRRSILLLLLFLGLPLAAREPPAEEQPRRPPVPLRPGVRATEVLRDYGPPTRIARQVLHRRVLEQWIYEGPPLLRIDLRCERGQELEILTVHPTR